MASIIGAFALQQLQEMEQLQRDFGRRKSKRRGAANVQAQAMPSPRREQRSRLPLQRRAEQSPSAG